MPLKRRPDTTTVPITPTPPAGDDGVVGDLSGQVVDDARRRLRDPADDGP
ncbi:hypothetical protein [Kineococcus auxinigenes]